MGMNDKPERAPAKHYVLAGLGLLAAGVLVLVSMAMNYNFGLSLGRDSANGQIYGFASVAADALKILAPFAIAAAWQNRRWSYVAAGSLVWLVVMSYAILSALGHASLNRNDSASHRAVDSAAYKDLRADLKRAQDQLAAVPQHRPVATIEAEMSGMKSQRPWAASQGCTDATTKISREFCQQFHKLGAELGSARATVSFEERISAINTKLSSTATSALAEADPQAGVLSRLFNIDMGTVQTALVLFVVVLIEVGAGLGPYMAMSWFPDRPTRRRKSEQAQEETDEQAAPEPVAGQGSATVVPFPSRPTVSEAPQEVVPTVSSDVLPYSEERAEVDLRGLTAKLGVIPSQDVLAVRWGVAKGTVSKWLGAWEWVGTTRVGRFKNVHVKAEVQQRAAA